MADKLTKAKLAAFYTPLEIASVLTDWAITGAHCTVFDPSFGGCAFLYGALSSLRRFGSSKPGRQLYGVDIDADALNHLDPVLREGGSLSRFPIMDFFSLPRGHSPWTKFDAVVGNPPYLRHHSLTRDQQERAAKVLESLGIRLCGTASYWAYFTACAPSYLRPGGRMAMVLPGAFLHADYASPVRKLMIDTFEEVNIILLHDRLFSDTIEESIILCGKNAYRPHRRLRVGSVHDLEHLQAALEQPCDHLVSWPSESSDDWLTAIVAPQARQVLADLRASGVAVEAGEWVQARIGVVTGDNDFFIVSSDQLLASGIPDTCSRPIIRRSSHVKGLFASDEQLSELYGNSGRNQLLVLPSGDDLPSPVRAYLEWGKRRGADQRTKCRMRRPWYSISDTASPSAFVPAMSGYWPRIIINRSKYTCTNNIYRLEWSTPRDDVDWIRLALGSLSTASQLSAELVGRSYGGGVLKLEPREFARWLIPLLPSQTALKILDQVDAALLADNPSRATAIVDTALGHTSPYYGPDELGYLREARDLLRRRRSNT